MPLAALTRTDLKWSLEEKLALPVDIIFLEKGKKEALSRTRVFKKRNLIMKPDPVILSSET